MPSLTRTVALASPSAARLVVSAGHQWTPFESAVVLTAVVLRSVVGPDVPVSGT